jgi:two-component system, chemotaxis family, protein-glutamate methylesterase/glutaminase
MILFCEECGTRHDVESEIIDSNGFQFPCHTCQEVLIVTNSGKINKSVQAAMQNPGVDSERQGVPKLKVLIVDDSKLIRKVLKEIIESDGCKEVIGEAENGKLALDLLPRLEPDVITLDINMPVMDGLTTLKHIMIIRPTPTVMISALTKEGAMETFDSLKYGAIDFLSKPSQTKGADLKTQKFEINSKIQLAADVQIESVRYLRRPCQKERNIKEGPNECRFIMAIGVAEGGYGALLNVLPSLRADLPAVYMAVMRQPSSHIDSFAEYLGRCSPLAVKRVSDGIQLHGGICYLAAADEYVHIAKEGNRVYSRVNQRNSLNDEGPIDFLMRSVAEIMQAQAAGIILTGAGNDGIEGLGEILRHGGVSFVQDPISCLYKETPITAVGRYAVDYLVSDKQMAGAINSYLVSHST